MSLQEAVIDKTNKLKKVTLKLFKVSMYICLEGVKGSGKTTLFNSIVDYFNKHNIDYSTACPTKPIANCYSAWELFHSKLTFLQKLDLWYEILYAKRSNYVAKSTNWKKQIVIGDRSIVTSYVTRWNKYDNIEFQIKRVNTLEKKIPAPDYILFLEIQLNEVLNRLTGRTDRNYGQYDEKPEQIIKAMDAYDTILNGFQIPRLSNTKWFKLDANKNKVELFDQSIHIISKIMSNNFLQ